MANVKYQTLRNIRKASKFTIRELAAYAGCSQTSYLFKETGKVKMSLREALKFSKMLDVPVEQLFQEELMSDESNIRD